MTEFNEFNTGAHDVPQPANRFGGYDSPDQKAQMVVGEFLQQGYTLWAIAIDIALGDASAKARLVELSKNMNNQLDDVVALMLELLYPDNDAELAVAVSLWQYLKTAAETDIACRTSATLMMLAACGGHKGIVKELLLQYAGKY